MSCPSDPPPDDVGTPLAMVTIIVLMAVFWIGLAVGLTVRGSP